MGLHIIGELCHFLEIMKIVMSLSPKSVILAGPVAVRLQSGWRVGISRNLEVRQIDVAPFCRQSATRLQGWDNV